MSRNCLPVHRLPARIAVLFAACAARSFGRACRKESVDVHRARGASAFSGARLSRQNFFLGKFLGAI